MQNNTLLYGIGALVVIAAGVGIWMYGGGSKGEMMGDNTNGRAQTQSTSLKNLVASQSPQKCTFTSGTDISSSSGTVYVAGGKMRGDFVSSASGRRSNSHMVVEGTTSYVWTDEMGQGFKMSFDMMTEPQTQTNDTQTIDPNENVDYACSPWMVDASVFVLPTNITFQDMSALAPPGAAGASGEVEMSGNASQCAACDQAPNEGARSQCRAALQCK